VFTSFFFSNYLFYMNEARPASKRQSGSAQLDATPWPRQAIDHLQKRGWRCGLKLGVGEKKEAGDQAAARFALLCLL
jgi:hypothetical protein